MSEQLTQEEVRVAHVRDREQAVAAEVAQVAGRLGLEPESAVAPEPLEAQEREELQARLERLERRRERLGPVNPLAAREYEEALEHVEELESQRKDLEEALAELRRLIRETDRRIRESFEETFEAARAQLRGSHRAAVPGRVRAPPARQCAAPASRSSVAPRSRSPASRRSAPRLRPTERGAGDGEPQSAEALSACRRGLFDFETPGIEIEVTPAGKTTKRLSLLSGGEKSLVALAFMFAVFLARPCPFYILDEVEAALDDTNIDRFLSLVRAYADRAQFIVITHQRRTMEAADVLYGVSMGGDGVSKIVSRRLEAQPERRGCPRGHRRLELAGRGRSRDPVVTMERPRLLLVPMLTEVEWVIRPLLEEWAEVASYDAPGVGDEPAVETPARRRQRDAAWRRSTGVAGTASSSSPTSSASPAPPIWRSPQAIACRASPWATRASRTRSTGPGRR